MLKRKLCEVTFTWKLTCGGPLLIADGRYEHDKGTKDPHKVFISHTADEKIIKNAVKTKTANNLGLRFYVPGTSLRGPFRAQAERIIRSLLPENAPPPVSACDPFQDDVPGDEQKGDEGGEKRPGLLSCSKRLETEKNRWPTAYVAACPACKLFGCTGTASRIRFTDADLALGYSSVYRDMIGIDRFTGGVSSGANMRFHALENTVFTTTVTVTNFELWQLGLLAYVFRDFQEGLVSIGFGKTKGFGSVKGNVEKITLAYPAGKAGGKIQHLGSLTSQDECKCYGLDHVEAPVCDMTEEEPTGLSLYETFKITDQDAFWAVVAPAFNDFITARNKEAKP